MKRTKGIDVDYIKGKEIKDLQGDQLKFDLPEEAREGIELFKEKPKDDKKKEAVQEENSELTIIEEKIDKLVDKAWERVQKVEAQEKLAPTIPPEAGKISGVLGPHIKPLPDIPPEVGKVWVWNDKINNWEQIDIPGGPKHAPGVEPPVEKGRLSEEELRDWLYRRRKTPGTYFGLKEGIEKEAQVGVMAIIPGLMLQSLADRIGSLLGITSSKVKLELERGGWSRLAELLPKEWKPEKKLEYVKNIAERIYMHLENIEGYQEFKRSIGISEKEAQAIPEPITVPTPALTREPIPLEVTLKKEPAYAPTFLVKDVTGEIKPAPAGVVPSLPKPEYTPIAGMSLIWDIGTNQWVEGYPPTKPIVSEPVTEPAGRYMRKKEGQAIPTTPMPPTPPGPNKKWIYDPAQGSWVAVDITPAVPGTTAKEKEAQYGLREFNPGDTVEVWTPDQGIQEGEIVTSYDNVVAVRIKTPEGTIVEKTVDKEDIRKVAIKEAKTKEEVLEVLDKFEDHKKITFREIVPYVDRLEEGEEPDEVLGAFIKKVKELKETDKEARSGDDVTEVHGPGLQVHKRKPKIKEKSRTKTELKERELNKTAPGIDDGKPDYGIQDFRAQKKEAQEECPISKAIGYLRKEDKDESDLIDAIILVERAGIDPVDIDKALGIWEENRAKAEKYIEKAVADLREIMKERKGQLEGQMEKEVPVELTPVEEPIEEPLIEEEEELKDLEEVEPPREEKVKTDVEELRRIIDSLAKSVYSMELTESQRQELSKKVMDFLSDSISDITVKRVQQIVGDALGEIKASKGFPRWLG